MFPTTVTIHNVADLQKVISVLYPTTAAVEITDKSRDVTKEVAAAPVEKPAKTSKSTPAADPAVTYKEAAEAVTKLSRTKGRDAAIAVLKSFGADKLPDVKPEDFAAVVAACQAALEV